MKFFQARVISPLVLGVVLFSFPSLQAQDGDFTEIFRGAPDDARQYLQDYVRPAMLSFSNGMAGGWYNTAKTHKTLGLDLTLSLNVANMPSSERIFTFNPASYQLLRVQGASGNTELPTLVGGNTSEILLVQASQTIEYNGREYQYDSEESFNAPNGFDLDDVPFVGVPAPTLQLGIGLFKNTDLKLRFVPEQNFDDYSVKLFGIGILHDVKQWIPGIRHVPVDISLFFGTSKLNAEFMFEGGDPLGITADWSVRNGLAEFEARATTFQAVVSKKMSFFTPYAAIGTNSVNTSLVVNGDYELFNLRDVSNPLNHFRYETVSGNDAPIGLDFSGGGGMRASVGFRLKLLFVTLHTDYTFQKYNTFTLGLGFTFRENN